MKIIKAKTFLDYELFDVRRFHTAQIAVFRQAYFPDRLYAWKGRHTAPTKSWMQAPTETSDEFRKRVKADL